MYEQLIGFGDALESQFGYALRGLFFWGQLLAVWAMSSRLLLKPYGTERLFWGERWWVQLGSMLFVGLHGGTVLFTWYLLDVPDRFFAFFDPLPKAWTLFAADRSPPGGNGEGDEVREVGHYLLSWLIVYGLFLLAAKFVTVILLAWAHRRDPAPPPGELPLWLRYLRSRWFLAPGVAGYLAALGFAVLLHQIDERGAWRFADPAGKPVSLRKKLVEWTDDSGVARTLLRGKLSESLSEKYSTDMAIQSVRYDIDNSDLAPRGPQRSYSTALHGVATYLVLVGGLLALGYFAMLKVGDWYSPRYVVAGPTVLVCAVLAVVTLVYGFAVFHLASPISFVLFFGGVFVVTNSPLLWNYRYKFPGLDYARAKRFPLANYDAATGVGLLDDGATLNAHIDRLAAERGVTKPRLVLLAVTGGGIRAAVWVPVVLEGLRRRDPAILDQTRLITGASGGMVGAGLYVAAMPRDPESLPAASRLGLCSGVAAQQSLLAVVQTMVLRDLTYNLVGAPFLEPWDRGLELERQWTLAAAEQFQAPGANPYEKTFAELADAEKNGRRPSLIFSPVTVEDQRRVLISNLDLAGVASACGPRMTGDVPATYSRSNLELFKMFPEARAKLKVVTAARMNATFPIVSPLASLPTMPARRLMDAGLYDNYGVELLASWMFRHRETLLERTSGVALVEVRAFPLDAEGASLARPSGLAQLVAGPLAAVTYPFLALLNGRGPTCFHRNNALLAALDSAFRHPDIPDFFQTCPFELDEDASLNWYLSSLEQQAIAGAWGAVAGRADALSAWLARQK